MVTRTITVACATPIQANELTLAQLGAAVDALNAVVPITFLHFTPLAVPATPPSLGFNYQLRAADGRAWNQVVTFANASDTDPTMTFAVPAGWKPSEYIQQRAIRDLLIQLVVRFGATTVKYDFA